MKNWIDINSCLPKESDSVLIYTNDKETKIVHFTSDLTSSISHWMKLPNPPHYDKIYNICLKEFRKLQAKNESNLHLNEEFITNWKTISYLKEEFMATLETEVDFNDITELEYTKGLEFMDRIVQEIYSIDEAISQN